MRKVAAYMWAEWLVVSQICVSARELSVMLHLLFTFLLLNYLVYSVLEPAVGYLTTLHFI